MSTTAMKTTTMIMIWVMSVGTGNTVNAQTIVCTFDQSYFFFCSTTFSSSYLFMLNTVSESVTLCWLTTTTIQKTSKWTNMNFYFSISVKLTPSMKILNETNKAQKKSPSFMLFANQFFFRQLYNRLRIWVI